MPIIVRQQIKCTFLGLYTMSLKKKKNWKDGVCEIHVYMDEELYALVCREAEKEDRSLTAEVRSVLKMYYNHQPKETKNARD